MRQRWPYTFGCSDQAEACSVDGATSDIKGAAFQYRHQSSAEHIGDKIRDLWLAMG
jgi:hypothetical protein